MLSVALTGGIGCGKSTVCDLFVAQGVPIIDTDIISRQLVEPGQSALQQIISYFGKDIVDKQGHLNRAQLADIVFNNEQDRKALEGILHPLIRQQVQSQIQQLTSPYCIVAVPLLFETGQQNEYMQTLVVDCSRKQQLERANLRDQRSMKQIESIINSQVDRQLRLERADHIIDNSKDMAQLEKQVGTLHKKFLNLAEHSIE